MTTGEWNNPPQDVILEPHVWLGSGVSVGKGVVIGHGSIIGAKSLVLKSCERFSLLAGIPAKLIQPDVTWDRHAQPTEKLIEEMRALAAEVKPASDS